MISRHKPFEVLKTNYLFSEIERRERLFLKSHPQVKLLNMGIGDASLPIPKCVAEAMARKALEMAEPSGFRGYGPSEGLEELRSALSTSYYKNRVVCEEIFVSDGANSELCRLLALFGRGRKVALQDPAYPVYAEGSLLFEAAGITPLPCTPENRFFPDLSIARGCDLLFFCSPNNPTGVAYTKEQLQELVAFAHANNQILLYDVAYAPFVRQSSLPRSIYEIDGAKEVAIEVGSFSKLVGFTGIRLGWTVVPKELKYKDGGSVLSDYRRLMHTLFNGASRIVQAGGVAALSKEGVQATDELIDHYLGNALLIKKGLGKMGAALYGGEAAPYVWARFPKGTSWELFDALLHQRGIVSIPGSGFGACGEGFLRFSAFCSRADAKRLVAMEEQCLL